MKTISPESCVEPPDAAEPAEPLEDDPPPHAAASPTDARPANCAPRARICRRVSGATERSKGGWPGSMDLLQVRLPYDQPALAVLPPRPRGCNLGYPPRSRTTNASSTVTGTRSAVYGP